MLFPKLFWNNFRRLILLIRFQSTVNFLIALQDYKLDTLHDLVLCKEVVFVNPYSAKKKSLQRSALWQDISDNLQIRQEVLTLKCNWNSLKICGTSCRSAVTLQSHSNANHSMVYNPRRGHKQTVLPGVKKLA